MQTGEAGASHQRNFNTASRSRRQPLHTAGSVDLPLHAFWVPSLLYPLKDCSKYDARNLCVVLSCKTEPVSCPMISTIAIIYSDELVGRAINVIGDNIIPSNKHV